MAERPDCARMGQLLPELALGVAAGDERARALGHLARCVPCRSVLESAAAAADALLLIAPEREPPPGFETRVLAGLLGRSGAAEQGGQVDQADWADRGDRGEWTDQAQPAPRWTPREPHRRPRYRTAPSRPQSRPGPARRTEPPARPASSSSRAELSPPAWPSPYAAASPRAGAPRAGAPHRARSSSRAVPPRTARWRRRLFRLATTVTIAGLVGGALWWRTDDDRHLAAGYRATLAIAHGQYMRAAPLLTESVAHAGYIVAYEGEPSWIVLVVRTGDVSGDYAVRLVTRDGRPIPLGTMNIAHGQATWGATISTSVDQIAAVTLTRPSALAITARLG
jgi:hypothetical protein